MLNNRGDKFEGQEESEYHFSDEEVNYEVDTESTPTETAASGEKPGLAKFAQSKRMLIGLGLFIILVFIAYKLITPSSRPAPTDVITPVTQPKGPMQSVAPPSVATAPITPPPVPGSAPQTQQPSQAFTQPLPASPISVPQTMAPAPPAQPTIAQPPVASQQPVVAAAQPLVQQVPPPSSQVQLAEQSSLPPLSSPSGFNQGQPGQQPQPPSQLSPVVAQPIQQPSTFSSSPVTISAPFAVTTPSSASYQPVSQLTGVDAKIAILEANNQKLVAQLQADYVQRLNDFYNQNKQLQEQLQSLSTRVTTMESQLNQLVQGLTRQQNQGMNDNLPVGPQSQAPAPKLPYNVQAIIPGRAWLRSDNGETVTVAEGDAIKDIGRVTKIDPYDGIVEISAGGKIVSLSYGNTG